jgi:hypothetical protein
MFSPKSQMGVYGFQFTSDGTDAISSIATDKAALSDKVFNLAGQRVSENYKGVVIQNGKKFVK